MRQKLRPIASAPLLVLALNPLAVCTKKSVTAEPDAAAVASAAVAKNAPSSAPSAEPAPPPVVPVCKVEHQKLWTKGVNMLTGLTATTLPDGKDVIGLAVGNAPYTLTVASDGQGTLAKVAVDPANDFAKAPKPTDGTRFVNRVTPIRADGKLRVLVDYRDEVKTKAPAGRPEVSKTRRVACGPVEKTERWVAWEGPNYVDEPKHQKDPAAAIKGAGYLAPGRAYQEIRDCRSFYDSKHDDAWVVGSMLTLEDGASITGKSELFVVTASTRPATLASEALSVNPWKRVDYEMPVSHETSSGVYLVAARTNAGLTALLLDRQKKPIGTASKYPGVFQMPDVSDDGADDVFVAAQSVANGGLALRAMRIAGEPPTLPKSFANVQTDEDGSKTEGRPEFLRDSKGQRWIAYIEDAEKGKGRLEIIPVTATFRAAGKPYEVTGPAEKATEARLFPRKEGGFIVVYTRDGGDGVLELVSEDLSCQVKS